MAQDVNKKMGTIINCLSDDQQQILLDALTQYGAEKVMGTLNEKFPVHKGLSPESPESSEAEPMAEAPVEEPMAEEPAPEEAPAEEAPAEEPAPEEGEKEPLIGNKDEGSKYSFFDEAEKAGKSPLAE